MNRSRYQLTDEIWLDARRAIWFAEARVLAVADTHLGYAWAQRLRGQLLPLSAVEDSIERLVDLQKDYNPLEIVVLGDIVHRAVELPVLEAELNALVNSLTGQCALKLVAGNHDRDLGQLLKRRASPVPLLRQMSVGPHLLVHGDEDVSLPSTAGGRLVMGHEHPAVILGDGVTTSVKCPCFLIGERVIILPAFSRWAAGTVVGSCPFMSARARNAKFTRAVAIVGDKLLPMAL